MSNDEVIRRVSTMFIPVAVNLYEIRKDPGPAGDLFRSVARQMDQYQGFWIVSPEGKALAKYHSWEGDPAVPENQRVPMTLEAGLKAFGPVTPREVKPTDLLPYRGKGVRPDGSVTLAIYGRLLHREQSDGPMSLDSVTFGAAEWAHFAPPKNGGTREWTVPEGIARNLARRLLSPGDSSGVFRPESVGLAELTARVESMEDGRARIRFTGNWKAQESREGRQYSSSATAEGIALYDVEKKSMRSLLLVSRGKNGEGPGARETGGVVEWTSELSPEKRNR